MVPGGPRGGGTGRGLCAPPGGATAARAGAAARSPCCSGDAFVAMRRVEVQRRTIGWNEAPFSIRCSNMMTGCLHGASAVPEALDQGHVELHLNCVGSFCEMHNGMLNDRGQLRATSML